jgi:allantoicase
MKTKPDFRTLPDVAGRVLGGAVIWAEDEFFASADHLLSPAPAAHDPTLFDARGKVYDGWETRRRRTPGEDAVIVRLAAPALVRGVTVDTAHFLGNYPPFASVQGAFLLGYPAVADVRAADWFTVVARSELEGNSANVLDADDRLRLASHVRLTIIPDGGVARLRVWGEVVPDPRLLGGRIDLASTLNGGRVVRCSNMFYSAPANVLRPGKATVMSDGWETARRRDDGNDWLTVALAAPGVLHSIVVDTSRFVGNSPGWAALTDDDTGEVLMERTALLPDTEHRLRIRSASVVQTVRLDIYPDGGLSRLRILGEVPPAARPALAERWLDVVGPAAAAVDTSEFFD